MIKGNNLQKRLIELGFKTDGEDWDKPVLVTDDEYCPERWEE